MSKSLTGLSFAEAHAAWHSQVEAQRTAPHGPLSATALHWLTETAQRFPEVPGSWRADSRSGVVTTELPEDSKVTLNGTALSGTVAFPPLVGLDSITLAWEAQRIELAARSGRLVLRPRNPESRDRIDYGGTGVFPADPAWVLRARFLPAPRNAVEVSSAAGERATQHYDSAGIAEFQVGGKTLRLTLFGEIDGSPLRAIFADRSGEDLTFPAARFVAVTRLDEQTVEIDFNRTTNPPCAYSLSATCPFPPPENRLPVRIEAGELRPGIPFDRAASPAE